MGFFTEEIAIDLGTANTLIIHNDKVVINSPSIVAMDRSTKRIIAIGEEAKFMQGKTHENIKTIRPLKDGVIADFEASEKMISELIRSIPTLKKRWFSPTRSKDPKTLKCCTSSGPLQLHLHLCYGVLYWCSEHAARHSSRTVQPRTAGMRCCSSSSPTSWHPL